MSLTAGSFVFIQVSGVSLAAGLFALCSQNTLLYISYMVSSNNWHPGCVCLCIQFPFHSVILQSLPPRLLCALETATP